MYESIHLFSETPGQTQAERDWNEVVQAQQRESAAYRAEIYGHRDYPALAANEKSQEEGATGRKQAQEMQTSERPLYVPGPYTSEDNIRAERFGWTKKPPKYLNCDNIHTPENSWEDDRICMDDNRRPWTKKRIPMTNKEIYEEGEDIRVTEKNRALIGNLPILGPIMNYLTEDGFQQWKAQRLDKMSEDNYYYRPYSLNVEP